MAAGAVFNVSTHILGGNISDSTTWQSSPLSELNWSNCTAITEYRAEVINIENENGPNLSFRRGNLGKLDGYLNASIPEGWDRPTNPIHLTAWFFDVMINTNFVDDPEWLAASDALDASIVGRCRPEFCSKLGVQGDPDVLGPGVSQRSRSLRVPCLGSIH